MLTILGCGAIGATIAHQCHIHKIDFNLSLKPNSNLIEASNFLYFTDINRNKHAIPIAPAVHPITNLIVTVKAYQVELAISQLVQQHKLSENANIMLLHNGMGTKKLIKTILPKANVLQATTTYAALSRSKLDIEQTGIGHLQVENPYSSVEQCNYEFFEFNQLINKWKQASWQHNIEDVLWLKLYINCVINPLTAIHQIKNGDLNQRIYADSIFLLLNEISLICKTVSPNLADEQIRQKVFEVIANTADNYSSMNRDIANKRKTEIDFITGYLLKTANKLGLKLPNHQALYQKIKLLEAAANI